MPCQHAEIALGTGKGDHVHILGEEHPLRRNEIEMNFFGHCFFSTLRRRPFFVPFSERPRSCPPYRTPIPADDHIRLSPPPRSPSRYRPCRQTDRGSR